MVDWAPMAELIPEGERGRCKVTHFEVSEEDSKYTRLRAAVTGRPGEHVDTGKYCRLMVNNMLMMTDTHFEKDSCLDMVMSAHGDVFIAGLGLGMILVPILRKPEVKTVTVVEKYHEVIRLVRDPLLEHLDFEHSRKLYVTKADVFEWKLPPKRTVFFEGCNIPTGIWDTIYFDIWADICADNLTEITRLKRKFSRRLRRENPDAWMGAWQEHQLRRLKDQERRL